MKIVVTGTRGIPNILGGVETHCEELYPRIASKDVEIVLIRRKCYVNDNIHSYNNIQLYDISTSRLKAFEAIIHTFKAVWLARFRFHADIIHIHAIGPALLTPFARLLGLKIVFTHHGFDYDREKWGKMAKMILKLGERWGVKYANSVISISPVITEFLKNHYRRKDVFQIYNGVPDATFIEDTSFLKKLNIESGNYFFAMGRFVPEKNFDDLINAFNGLSDNNLKLVIAGDNMVADNYSLSLKQMAAKNPAVVMPGILKGAPLHTLLTHARSFILPSSHEGLPIALLEAMSYQLPVVVSDIPANKAVGLDSNAYFETGNIEKLKMKLKDISSKPLQRKKYDMKPYNWDNIAAEVHDIYASLMH